MEKFVIKSRSFRAWLWPVVAVFLQIFGGDLGLSGESVKAATGILVTGGAGEFYAHNRWPDGKKAVFKASGRFMLPFILLLGVASGTWVLTGCATDQLEVTQDIKAGESVGVDVKSCFSDDAVENKWSLGLPAFWNKLNGCLPEDVDTT